jgi:hypothetical protein
MQTTTAATIAKNATRTARPDFRMIEMGGFVPAGHVAVQARIIAHSARALRVAQGARLTAWLPLSAIFIERGAWSREWHEGARLYVPRHMAEDAGLFEIDERQQQREREILAQRATSAFTGRVHIVGEIAAFMDADSAEDAGRFDEALSGCRFESAEQIAQRDHDGRRYNVIAIDPSEEQTAAGRAQIAAYAVIEHIADLMSEDAYIEIIRECKHWMRAIEEERDGMEPQTRAAVWTVLVRARAAANAARNQHPQSMEAAAARRAAELAALAARTH